MYTSLQWALVSLQLLLSLPGSRGLLVERKLQELPGPAEFVPRLALIKFPRTGSTLVMKELTRLACPSPKNCSWVPEVFDSVCTSSAGVCDSKAAISLIHRLSSCTNKEGCGWSLNLFKHQRSGLRLWPQIVDVMAAQPMTVVFLVRKDPIAQFVSYEVGAKRKALLTSKAFRSQFGRGLCNAYQYYNCPPQVVDWVDARTSFELDVRLMHDEVLRGRREAKVYADMEEDLRKQGHPNLRIMHVTYEELLEGGQAWRDIFEAVGHPEASIPNMLHSNYSRFITNWAQVVAYSQLHGRSK